MSKVLSYIKQIVSKNHKLKSFLKVLRWYFKYCIFVFERNVRKIGYVQKRYKKLIGIKETYKDKRCFIIATGPSLTIEDLELLKGEITFGVNSLCLVFPKTDWRPSFFGIIDLCVYRRIKAEIPHDIPIFMSKQLLSEKECTHNDAIGIPYDAYYNAKQKDRGVYNVKFSDNAIDVVYGGYTVVYAMMQIATYMGFDEIYLLGADCNYSTNTNNYFMDHGYVDPTLEKAEDRMIEAYKIAKKYADEHAVKIINCTRGGKLEVFERMTLEEVLNRSKG